MISAGVLALDTRSVLMIGQIVLIDIASSQNWNAPSLEIIRRNIVERRRCALIQRQNIPLITRIKRLTGGAVEQRDVAADRRALESWNHAQRGESLFHEMLARSRIRI